MKRLLDNCYKEIGYRGANASPPNRYNKYAEYLDSLRKTGVNIYNGNKNGYHWCDVFVDYMFITTYGVEIGMKLLCQPFNSLGAGCTYSARYYKQKNQLYNKPEVGDQIFFGTESNCNHTGIVIKVDNIYVYTIEGNSNNSVAERKYRLTDNKIYAYGRPDWRLVMSTEPKRYNKLEELPDWCRPQIAELIEQGYLAGSDGKLDISMDMIRCLVILSRIVGELHGNL